MLYKLIGVTILAALTVLLSISGIFEYFGFHTSKLDSTTTKQTTDTKIKVKDIDPKALKVGLRAYGCARKQGLDDKQVLTIIDYSKPSSEPRMWVLDMKNKKVDFEELVAHGKGSGLKNAHAFSNKSQSHQSSLGVFLTKNTYIGHKGYSLRLEGLEKGINDAALSRDVVVHGANYVSKAFVKNTGRLGRSWGCPAVSKKLAKPTIDKIKNGTLLVAYYPDKHWLQKSEYLHC